MRQILFIVLGVNILIGAEAAVLYCFVAPGLGKSATSLAPMLQRVIPAVVTLRVTGQKMVTEELSPANATPSPPETETFRTGGSGVIVDSRAGYLLTNNHVIDNAINIDVGLSDGRHLAATLVGRDIGTDLALLKVDAKDLPSIKIGNSDRARVGDMVVAVGNPYGLEGTATLGIISAVMRTEIGHEAFEDYLQIDAQTNPGNSGGALVNVSGELIGINTVIAGGRGKNFTIGFAIPINMARIIKDEIIKHGRMRRGLTGLMVEDVPHDQSTKPGPLNSGALVSKVLLNSPASGQGIKPGDIVLQAAGKPVRSAAEYVTRVSTIPLGRNVPLLVQSGSTKRLVTLTIASGRLEPSRVVLQEKMGGIAGLVVGDILPGNPLYGDVRGAQILEVPAHSATQKAGLATGDVIVGIEGNRVVSADDLVRKIEPAGLQYRVDIVRDGRPIWVRMNR